MLKRPYSVMATISAILGLLVFAYAIAGFYFWWAQPPTQDPAIASPSLVANCIVLLLFAGAIFQLRSGPVFALLVGWVLLLGYIVVVLGQLVVPHYRTALGLPPAATVWQFVLPFLHPLFLVSLAGFVLALLPWLRSRREKARTSGIANV